MITDLEASTETVARKAIVDGEKIYATVVSTKAKIEAAAGAGREWKVNFAAPDDTRSESC